MSQTFAKDAGPKESQTMSKSKQLPAFESSAKNVTANYEELFDSGYNSNVQSKTYLSESETDISSSTSLTSNLPPPPQPKNVELAKLSVASSSSSQWADSGVCISTDSSCEISESSSIITTSIAPIEAKSEPTTTVESNTANLFELCQKQDDEGDSLLHLAIIGNYEDIACSIIRNRMISLEMLNSYNYLYQTPLHLAVLKQQHKVIQCLISRGVSIAFQDAYGNTPLHIACKYSLASIVQLFLVSCHRSLLAANLFDIRNYDGDTCMHLAAYNNNHQILELLLNTGASVNIQEGKGGKTPLHFAVEALNVPLVAFLVKKCRADPFAQNFADQTPVLLAYKMQSMLGEQATRAKASKIIRTLLENYEQAYHPAAFNAGSSSSESSEYSSDEN